MIAFRFREHLRGTFWLLDAPFDERAIDMTLEAQSLPVHKFARDQTARLRGRVTLERLAADVAVDGTLKFRFKGGEQRLRYDVGFTADDGKRLRIRGDKDLARWYAPGEAVSTVAAS